MKEEDCLTKHQTESVDCVITHPPREYIFRELRRIMKPISCMYLFVTDENLDFFIAGTKKFFRFKNVIAWERPNWRSYRTENRWTYGNKCSYIVYATKGLCLIRRIALGNSWYFKAVPFADRFYSEQLPIALVEFILDASTAEGDTVIDPYAVTEEVYGACENKRRIFLK